MSDYFGALWRSAGGPSPAPAPVATGAAAQGFSEQEVETLARVDVPAVQAPAAEAEPPPLRPAGPPGPPGSPALPARIAETSALPFVAPPRPPAQAAPASALPSTRADDVHPMVQAALRWVRAGAIDTARGPAHGDSPVFDGPPAGRADRVRVAPVRASLPAARPAAEGPSAPPDRPAESGPPVRAARQSTSTPELDIEIPARRQAPPVAPRSIEAATWASPDRVDISIGTIHVAVDAPPAARLEAPPAPAPQRVPMARTDARSSFSRSRLPRS